MISRKDEQFLRRALALAERGRLRAHPNPMVGCVIARGDRTLAEGHHAFFGGPHAEATALARAGARARGATAYVTLEPCAHWGKTPPCAQALVKSGIKRVVAAMKDPSPRVAGRGFALLRRAGLRVEYGALEGEARALNRAFIKVHSHGLPYVIWKTAQTLDGKIASRTGESRWITGPQARAMGHRLRAESDAVLVGGNTVRQDDPLLTSHGQGPDPLRLVMSRSLDISPKAEVFQGANPAWVVPGREAPASRIQRLRARGVKILKYFIKNNKEELKNNLTNFLKIGVNQLLLECGGVLSGAFLSAGLVDEVYCFVAPRLLGGRTALTSVEGDGWDHPSSGPALKGASSHWVGRDLLIHGFLH